VYLHYIQSQQSSLIVTVQLHLQTVSGCYPMAADSLYCFAQTLGCMPSSSFCRRTNTSQSGVLSPLVAHAIHVFANNCRTYPPPLQVSSPRFQVNPPLPLVLTSISLYPLQWYGHRLSTTRKDRWSLQQMPLKPRSSSIITTVRPLLINHSEGAAVAVTIAMPRVLVKRAQLPSEHDVSIEPFSINCMGLIN